MARNIPDASTVAANSTAEAAKQVARSKRKGMASIGTVQGAKHAGLEILASEIEDHPENQTRFVIVGYGIPAPTGHDKTSVVCFQREDRPGSLLAILQEFAARAINLTKLESRPTKREPRRLLLLHRLRGPRRRRARRRLPAQPRGQAGRGEVPRLVPGRRRRRAGATARGQQGVARRERVARRTARPGARAGREDAPRDRPPPAPRRARLPRRHRAQARRAPARRRGARGRRRAPRRCISRVEELRARQNAASKEIGKARARRAAGRRSPPPAR